MKLILASASPRRQKLLQEWGLHFETVEPNAPERLTGDDPAELAVENALAKARSVARERPAQLVLGADTVVHLNGRVIGKPADRPEAREILRTLSGTEHEVITGVAVVCDAHAVQLTGAARTAIRMKGLSEKDIDEYVALGEGLGKAGAYAVQESGDRYIEELRGSFTNVVGLPMELVTDLLAKARLIIQEPTEERQKA